MHKKLVILGLILVLAFVNWSIASKEAHLSSGDIVVLRLAPVDPRSLMQGDYMTLTFSLANQIYSQLPKSEDYQGWRRSADASNGFAKVSLNEDKLATLKFYEEADYGQFRVAKNGELLLEAMLDEKFIVITPPEDVQ